jgi:hypothetical protein
LIAGQGSAKVFQVKPLSGNLKFSHLEFRNLSSKGPVKAFRPLGFTQ